MGAAFSQILVVVLVVAPTIAAILTGIAATVRIANELKKRKILKDENAKQFVSQYNENEIRLAVSGYLPPKCSPGDPAYKERETHLADTRENIYRYMDRSIENQIRSYHLILADTGMGKTAFCINYFYRLRKNKKRVCLVSLASSGFLSHIKSITSKQDCILILDAFDEHAAGKDDGIELFSDLLKKCEDFKSVIITCRSQYFQGEDYIPRETPLPNISPKGLNTPGNFSLVRSYIAPFDDQEVAKYISKHFPLWNPLAFKARRKANKLAGDVPDLAYRPMLLEHLPELVSNKEWSHEIYDLYTVLVDGWLDREKKWIAPEKLLRASFEIAYNFSCVEMTDRLPKSKIENLVEKAMGASPDWQHLSTRSLLNCDSKGRYKFAHRSILEYLLVRLAITGDYRPLDTGWTPFMKELLVSWGHKNGDQASVDIARGMLSDARSRKNLYPLYDVWVGQNAFPYLNFPSLVARRTNADGDRLAPLAWRKESLQIRKEKEMWKIKDDEFNTAWQLINDKFFEDQNIGSSIKDVERVLQNNQRIRLPFLDEIISLLDGLNLTDSELIRDGDIFILADKPSANEKLLLIVGDAPKNAYGLKQIDKSRFIRNKGYKVGVYITGVSYNSNYHKRKVRQLYVQAR